MLKGVSKNETNSFYPAPVANDGTNYRISNGAGYDICRRPFILAHGGNPWIYWPVCNADDWRLRFKLPKSSATAKKKGLPPVFSDGKPFL